MPATVSSLAAKQQNFSISLFARLFKHFEFAADSPIQHLYTQYRMASDIMAWPNQYFYGGKLKCGSQDRRCPIINYKVIFQPITGQLCCRDFEATLWLVEIWAIFWRYFIYGNSILVRSIMVVPAWEPLCKLWCFFSILWEEVFLSEKIGLIESIFENNYY